MQQDSHNVYSAEDIHKYLSGRLTPAEMHAMEKAALDDPFLAEAMEGYEGMAHGDWDKQLAAAKAQFNDDETPARVIPLYRSKRNWWKAAAAILIIGGAAFFTYRIIDNKAIPGKEKDLAKTPAVINPAVNDTPVAKTTPVIIDKKVIAAKDQPAGKSESKETIAQVPKEKLSRVTDPAPQAQKITEPVTTTKDIAKLEGDKERYSVTSTAIPPVANNTTTTPAGYETPDANKAISNADVKKRDSKEALAKNRHEPEQQLNRSFVAQVVGTDNAPLPFANINIKTENFGTYADVKGNFRLISSDSLVTVEVRSVGFLPRTYTLNSAVAQNKIVLTEDATAFAETVIRDRGTGKASRRAKLLKDSIVNVEPADGWDNYNTYVSNNIDIPDDILKRDLHGEMEISFTIQPNGAITNISVDKSLCDNCDEDAAKKLIQQGPQWKLKKGKTGRARIKVQF